MDIIREIFDRSNPQGVVVLLVALLILMGIVMTIVCCILGVSGMTENSYRMSLVVPFWFSFSGVFVFSIFLLGGVVDISDTLRKPGKKGLLKSIGLGIFSVLVIGYYASYVIDYGHDLIVGPSYLEGVVESKEVVSVGRSYERRIEIEGQPDHYVVGGGKAWFDTIQVGQRLEFIYGPWTHKAFPESAR